MSTSGTLMVWNQVTPCAPITRRPLQASGREGSGGHQNQRQQRAMETDGQMAMRAGPYIEHVPEAEGVGYERHRASGRRVPGRWGHAETRRVTLNAVRATSKARLGTKVQAM